VVIYLQQDADLHMAQLMPLPLTVSYFSEIHIGFTFLVSALPGSPGQRAVKCVCVRVCNNLTKIIKLLKLLLRLLLLLLPPPPPPPPPLPRLHPFNGLFSRTTWVSCYQKGKTSLDLNEAEDGGV